MEEWEDLFCGFAEDAHAEEALHVGDEWLVVKEGLVEELVPAWCLHGGVWWGGCGAEAECVGVWWCEFAGVEVDCACWGVEYVWVGVEFL